MWQKLQKVRADILKKRRLLTLILLATCGATLYLLFTRLGLLMTLSQLPSVLCFSSCQTDIPVHPPIEGEKLLNYQKSLRELLGDNLKPKTVSILIEKSKYRLTLFHNLQPIKSYPVVFGSNPGDDKLYQGDQKTPEGVFHIGSSGFEGNNV